MELAARGSALRIRATKGLQLGLALAVALSSKAESSIANAGNFGRWETRLTSCQLQYRPTPTALLGVDQDCLKLRLEQSVEGQLSVRFMASGRDLIFVGTLAKGQRPMGCNGDGGCTPELPLKLLVSSVAEAAFKGSDLVRGIPRAQLARGECQIMPVKISCQAISPEGQSWSATATI